MKNISIILISAVLLLLAASAGLRAGDKVKEKISGKIAQGKEFVIAIPPNENQDITLSKIALEIYVTSQKSTTVTMTLPSGKKITKTVDSMQIQSFSSSTGELSYNLETYTSEKVLDNAIFISSPDSISVYVLDAKGYSADGYLALPVHSWGREYLHLSYYDFYEDLSFPPAERGGGFIVIASEDSTRCRITLRGRGGDAGRTMENRKIGDSIDVTLNKGQIYMVMGNGKTRGVFDLSGSGVVSDKPVGFISFHMRTMIPSFGVANGRNNLCEMLPPLKTWGKRYTTIEFKRNSKGDFFRLISAYDDNHWSVKSYDMATGKLLLEKSGVLAKKGDFFEYNEAPAGKISTEKSIRGISIWESSKPAELIQYSYSSDWDKALYFDPFMTLAIPQEQFVNTTVFQVPEGIAKFKDNWINIIAIGSKVDTAQKKLKTIKVDSQYLYEVAPELIQNKVPGTNLYWCTLRMEPGAHTLTGETKFGAYIYGFDDRNSYGWPAAMSIDEINTIDTLPPLLSIAGFCGKFNITATDNRDGQVKDSPQQEDKGLYSMELDASSYNVEMIPPGPIFLDDKLTREKSVQIKVLDLNSPAFAKIEVLDNEGNSALDSIFYSPDFKPNVNLVIFNKQGLEFLYPGEKNNVIFSIISDKWKETVFDSISFDYTFPHYALIVDTAGIKFHSGIDSLDHFQYIPVPGGNDTLRIHIAGLNNLRENSDLVSIPVEITLYEKKQFLNNIANLSTSPGADCMNISSDSALTNLDVCVFDLRHIALKGFSSEIFLVSPNPAKGDIFSVKYSSDSESAPIADIIDLTGKVVLSCSLGARKPGIYRENIDISNLPDGLYTIVLHGSRTAASGRLAIVR